MTIRASTASILFIIELHFELQWVRSRRDRKKAVVDEDATIKLGCHVERICMRRSVLRLKGRENVLNDDLLASTRSRYKVPSLSVDASCSDFDFFVEALNFRQWLRHSLDWSIESIYCTFSNR